MRHLWRHRRDVDEDEEEDGDEGEGEDRDEVAEDYKKQQGQRKAAHRLGSTGCHLVSGPETKKETDFENQNENEVRLRRRLRLVFVFVAVSASVSGTDSVRFLCHLINIFRQVIYCISF